MERGVDSLSRSALNRLSQLAIFERSVETAPGLEEEPTFPRLSPLQHGALQPKFILERTGLRKYFAVVVTDDDVEEPKPAPEIYLKVAALLAVSPDRCVVLEDSPYGVEAALAAGTTPIQVQDLSIPTPDVIAVGHCIVESLTDVQRILEQARAGLVL